MKIHRIDHVGINVNDLSAATAFFLELGFEVSAEWVVEGAWAGRIIGLDDVKSEVVMLQTPDGAGKVELSKFHSPTDDIGIQHFLANAHGIRHICLTIEDIEALVPRLEKHGAQLIGEIQNYENIYKVCYLRGPEGIILELAEEIS